jgi:hypothetical protein
MLVYGDLARAVAVHPLIESVEARLRQAAMSRGQVRGDLLTGAFIDAAGLVQGLVDAEFEANGFDDLSPVHLSAMELLKVMASGLARNEPAGSDELAAIRGQRLPPAVTLKTPEGYAFYALYPEAYARAAAAEPWPTPPLVIGLRSIGTGLAAVVAVASGASSAVTLRPCGHPYDRQVRPSPSLRQRLAEHAGPFAIVDEGPGNSGSSFGGVADLLEQLGVEASRIVYFPSHAGEPGAACTEQHRERWRRSRRAVLTLDNLLCDEPIADWFAGDIGPVERVEDLSGGAWRAGLTADSCRPPSFPAWERRKFRLTSSRGQWVARFAGLGAIGEAKLGRARALYEAGFGPRPIALRRGFLLQEWESGRSLAGQSVDREALLAHLASYLAFRAGAFPADPDEGADAATLVEMVRVNTNLHLDPPADLDQRRVHVDAKLQSWEWLQRPDGSFCKLDAIDHSAGHDLIGCQPIAWDVAGAAVEFDLSQDEIARLVAGLANGGGVRVSSETVRFFMTCDAAFHRGLWAMAGDRAQERRYACRLAPEDPLGEPGSPAPEARPRA